MSLLWLVFQPKIASVALPDFGQTNEDFVIMAAVPNGTTTGGPKTQNRSIHFLCRNRLANEEAVSPSIVRHQSACFHFRRTTGHTVSIRNVERSRYILRMPFVNQCACPLLVPFILSNANQTLISHLLGMWPATKDFDACANRETQNSANDAERTRISLYCRFAVLVCISGNSSGGFPLDEFRR
jgi:hypothetical protein